MIYRTYSELIQLPTFEERFRYLRLDGKIGDTTFGYDRYLNQMFYQSEEWRHFRNEIIVRDEGCDLAMPGHEIYPASCKDRRWSKILIHHLNPLSKEDILCSLHTDSRNFHRTANCRLPERKIKYMVQTKWDQCTI